MNSMMRYAAYEMRRRNRDGTFAEDSRMEDTMRRGGTRYEANRSEQRREEPPRVEPGRDEPIRERGDGTFRMRYDGGEAQRMIGFGNESHYKSPMRGDEFEHRSSPKERGYSHSTVLMPFDKRKAEEWVKGMKNADGSKGAHWTMEQAEKLMKQKGIDCEPEMFWAALNAEYSDRCEVYKAYGVDSPAFYADCVKAFWLEDEDAIEDKIAAYYTCIVKH